VNTLSPNQVGGELATRSDGLAADSQGRANDYGVSMEWVNKLVKKGVPPQWLAARLQAGRTSSEIDQELATSGYQ